MHILGIETSCDETAAAVVSDGATVRSSVISSQIQAHAAFGGVVPELAAREHLRAIGLVAETALQDSGLRVADLDGIAVTNLPGLVPALLVGLSYAKGIALATQRPLIGINHVLAHVYGAFLDDPSRLQDERVYPLLALAVSGGHTLLLRIAVDGTATVVGRTIDDAAGEAFDKAAKILRLGYPGGPIIDRLARTGNPAAVPFPRGLLPRSGHPVDAENRLNFSFSGLKTALLYHVQGRELSGPALADVAASYQHAIVDVLTVKTRMAAEAVGARTVVLCGGVACNSALRQALQKTLADLGRDLVIAPPRFCTDNAAMVAGMAWHYLRAGLGGGLDLAVGARLPVDLGTVPFSPGWKH